MKINEGREEAIGVVAGVITVMECGGGGNIGGPSVKMSNLPAKFGTLRRNITTFKKKCKYLPPAISSCIIRSKY
jgi:hypothetical protein